MCLGACAALERTETQRVPNWFYPSQHPLEFDHCTKTQIFFKSDGGASLQITIVEDPSEPGRLTEQYKVEWKIVSAPNEERSGVSVFPRSLLLAAFGIVECEIPLCARELVFQYDADFAALGRCIRKGDYLNIPAPGSGLPGDANLSVRLTEDLVERLSLFLG